MVQVSTVKNWEVGITSAALKGIHQKDINIAIYNRDVSTLKSEIDTLLEQNIEFRASGEVSAILSELSKVLTPQSKYSLIFQDIKDLLHSFIAIADAKSYRLLLATVNTNMCRRFHTDVNDLRMLCTYSGQGTLWLTEDNVNRQALDTYKSNESIVLDDKQIQQAETGAVLILKGAIYNEEGTKAIVHRSPTIEETGERRLLLRIDTNEFLNFDI